jgi:cupin 2 domain-containing protein
MVENIFSSGVPSSVGEVFTTLLENRHVRLERIISHGQASPSDFWYDQEENEWVMVLQGAARLEFENEVLDLKPGDYINIRAHRKHRVAWTTSEEPTIWLAVFYD